MAMARCGSRYEWAEECRRAGCKDCGTLHFDGLPPAECICNKEIAICGYVYQTTITRSETCPLHGRCRCGNGPSRYDDRREADFYEREWKPECPITNHRWRM